MKQLITLLFAVLCGTFSLQAQDTITPCDTISQQATANSIFNGNFVCDETGLRLHLNLDEETIEIPGMSFLGSTNGYLDGKTNNHVYGVWMLLTFSVEGNQVKMRFTNDIGSDSQDIIVTKISEDKYEYKAIGSNSITKVEGRKLVKIPSTMTLRRISD